MKFMKYLKVFFNYSWNLFPLIINSNSNYFQPLIRFVLFGFIIWFKNKFLLQGFSVSPAASRSTTKRWVLFQRGATKWQPWHRLDHHQTPKNRNRNQMSPPAQKMNPKLLSKQTLRKSHSLLKDALAVTENLSLLMMKMRNLMRLKFNASLTSNLPWKPTEKSAKNTAMSSIRLIQPNLR